MQVLVFLTDDGKSAEGSGPTLVVKDHPGAVLPPNPRSLEWRYFATMQADDVFFGSEAALMRLALSKNGSFISNRLAK
jgi:hypothetical protein